MIYDFYEFLYELLFENIYYELLFENIYFGLVDYCVAFDEVKLNNTIIS